MRLGNVNASSPTVDLFTREHATILNGRHVELDTELTVQGVGRCRFRALVTNPHNGLQWVDVIDKRKAWRSVNVEDVTRVHRVAKTREGSEPDGG